MLSVLLLSCKRLPLLEATMKAARLHFNLVEPTVNVSWICFDNGSSPDDQHRLQMQGFDLLILSNKNIGQGPAINCLFQSIQTPYFMLLEDDWVLENPNKIPIFQECRHILSADKNIGAVKLDKCHFLDFNDNSIYDGPFRVKERGIPFFIQNPHMLWGGFCFPPSIATTGVIQRLGKCIEEQPFRHGWAESEYSGRFSQQYVVAKSPDMLMFRHIGDQAAPGWQ